MNKTTAMNLMDQAMSAGMRAEVYGEPAFVDTSTGVPVTVAASYRLRVVAPRGILGASVLSVLAQAGVSLSGSDILVQ